MSSIVSRLTETTPMWGRAIAPVAEWVAQALWNSPRSKSENDFIPTRLTQRRRIEGRGNELRTGLIPTPQTVDPSKPFASSGFSAFTEPCRFAEDQGSGNLDYVISQKSQLAARFFVAESDQLVTFPGGAFTPASNTHGFNSPGSSEFVVFSLAHTYVQSNALLNQARIGFVRTSTNMEAHVPFKWSDVGVSEGEMNHNNELPSLNILGSLSMAPVLPRTYTQNSFVFNDVLSFLKGPHALKVGGSLTRVEDNLDFAGGASFVQFLSWPDFLLGLDASSNGTGIHSNVFQSSDLFGLLNRELECGKARHSRRMTIGSCGR